MEQETVVRVIFSLCIMGVLSAMIGFIHIMDFSMSYDGENVTLNITETTTMTIKDKTGHGYVSWDRNRSYELDTKEVKRSSNLTDMYYRNFTSLCEKNDSTEVCIEKIYNVTILDKIGDTIYVAPISNNTVYVRYTTNTTLIRLKGNKSRHAFCCSDNDYENPTTTILRGSSTTTQTTSSTTTSTSGTIHTTTTQIPTTTTIMSVPEFPWLR